MSVKIDLHIHSKYSGDSLSEPSDILKTAKKTGLAGIAVVDHGTIEGGLKTAKANKDESFKVIIGAEIKTDSGEVIGYFLNQEISSRSFGDVIDEMKAQDAIISIPHPFDVFRKNRIKKPEAASKYVDLVEVFNSRCILDLFNKKALEFSEKFNLGVTAGTDAHHLEEIGTAGVMLKGDDLRGELKENRDYFGVKNPLTLHAKATLERLIFKRL